MSHEILSTKKSKTLPTIISNNKSLLLNHHDMILSNFHGRLNPPGGVIDSQSHLPCGWTGITP